MPKLSALQWVVLVLFLAFYGFAVFAFTRDYYLRHPPRAVAAVASQAPHGLPQSSAPTWIQRQMQGGDGPAVDLTTTDAVMLGQQADELFTQKRYPEAIAVYRRVLELEPENADAHNDLGLALHYVGKPEEALQILRAGAEKAPGLQRIWLTLGFVSANAGDREGARTALEKARSLGPDTGIGQEAERLLGILAGE
jgi:tetratricopeptide (TPR) repeat protein